MEKVVEKKQVNKNVVLPKKIEVWDSNNIYKIPSRLVIKEGELPDVLKGFDYPISSRPIVIHKDLVIDLNKISTTISTLLQQIPSLYFEDDIKKVADFYFKGDEMIAQFSLMCNSKNVETSSRLDLVLTEKGFKVLEVNMGSSIGGIEFENFEPLIRKMHPELIDPPNKGSYTSVPTQSLYIKFIIDKIEQYVTGYKDEINIFFPIGKYQKDQGEEDRSFFNSLLNKELKKHNKKGNVFSGNISELKFSNGQLYFNNKIIHSVLILDYSLKDVSPDLLRAFMMDKVYFPDHLGTPLLGDKRNLALLRKLAIDKKFEPVYNDMILDYIPWTEIVEESRVIYEGEEYNMIELLQKKKDHFVIKIANGLQGKDVYVGKFLTRDAWNETIKNALENKIFIAQEFSDSIDIQAPDIANQWKPHKLVWGAFGFGNTYGGVWVRMSPAKTDTGVINSATGAVEAIVYERNM